MIKKIYGYATARTQVPCVFWARFGHMPSAMRRL